MNKTRPEVLITAGNTREKIDSVRWWSNIFTDRCADFLKARWPWRNLKMNTVRAVEKER